MSTTGQAWASRAARLVLEWEEQLRQDVSHCVCTAHDAVGLRHWPIRACVVCPPLTGIRLGLPQCTRLRELVHLQRKLVDGARVRGHGLGTEHGGIVVHDVWGRRCRRIGPHTRDGLQREAARGRCAVAQRGCCVWRRGVQRCVLQQRVLQHRVLQCRCDRVDGGGGLGHRLGRLGGHRFALCYWLRLRLGGERGGRGLGSRRGPQCCCG